MKKGLALFLLTGALFMSSPWNIENKNKQIEPVNIQKSIGTLILKKEEPIIKIQEKNKLSSQKEQDSTEYKDSVRIKIIGHVMDDINKEYLSQNTAEIEIFNNKKALRQEIINELKKVKHTYREDNPLINERYSQVNELSLNQSKVIYLMINSLKDSSFVNNIGEIIANDIENEYSELGGMVNFKEKNKIHLKCLESESYSESYKMNDKSNNKGYAPPSNSFSSKKIAYFHLHAEDYNDSIFAGSSKDDIFSVESNYKFNVSSWINEFIITSIKEGEFNIDYIGVDPEKGITIRIIDLGNYFYDTLKVKL
jgi:hypothetical protein